MSCYPLSLFLALVPRSLLSSLPPIFLAITLGTRVRGTSNPCMYACGKGEKKKKDRERSLFVPGCRLRPGIISPPMTMYVCMYNVCVYPWIFFFFSKLLLVECIVCGWMCARVCVSINPSHSLLLSLPLTQFSPPHWPAYYYVSIIFFFYHTLPPLAPYCSYITREQGVQREKEQTS
ncbi:hypothetical protein GGR58DRAFT_19648 [Xylaria digitata]|nr:hypothetical protein GGR58DRAFT_19648 [Xylaria digitata]